MKKNAFTLIELLVVIAIIAILAAILFPVFAQAKMAAKKTVALSNAKNLGTAMMLYMSDNDDANIKEYFGFPQQPTCDWGSVAFGTPGAFYNWRYALQTYHKSTDILRDTTNPFADKKYDTIAFDGQGVTGADIRMSANFAVNSGVIGFANGQCAGGLPEGIPTLTDLADVAGTIMLAPNRSQWNDLRWSWGSYGAGYGARPSSLTDNSWCVTALGSTGPSCPATGNGPIHAVGKHISFVWCDGHAKGKPYSQTLRINQAAADDWNATAGGVTQADRIAVSNSMFPEYQ